MVCPFFGGGFLFAGSVYVYGADGCMRVVVVVVVVGGDILALLGFDTAACARVCGLEGGGGSGELV